MIDVHSHILPDLDDGSPDVHHSIAVMKEAARQGVQTIFATPHSWDGVFDCRKADILSAWQLLSEAKEMSHIDIQVLPGAEVHVSHDLIKRFDAGDLLTLGDAGRFLLLELPSMFIVNAMFHLIRQLDDRGVVPVIAHAERNPMIAGRLELAEEFRFHGAVLQVTAGSLTGDFGKPVLKTARTLLEKDLVFCLGSDWHPGRKYQMKQAEKKLLKWIGRLRTESLLWNNPMQLVEGCDSLQRLETERQLLDI